MSTPAVFTISPGGNVGPAGIELISIQRGNMEPDQLTLRQRIGVGPGLAWGQRVRVSRVTQQIFSGRVVSVEAIDDRWKQVSVLGPWWVLERRRYVRVAGEAFTSLVQLGVNIDGDAITRSLQVLELMGVGAAVGGAIGNPFSVSMQGLGDAGIFPAGIWVRDSTLADCVRLMMDPVLDGYIVCDHESSTPVMRAGRFRDRTPARIRPGQHPVISVSHGLRRDLDLAGIIVTRRADDVPVDSQGAGGDPSVPIAIRGAVGSAFLPDATVLQIDGGEDDFSLPERSPYCAGLWNDSQLGNTSLSLVMVGGDHPVPGQVVTLVGSSTRYNVQSSLWDLSSNRVTIQCGPPRRLGVTRLADVAMQARREEPGQSRYGPRRVRARDPYEPFVRGGVLYFEPGSVNGVITKWQDIALNAVPPPSQAGITGETVFAAFLLVKAEVTFADLWITAATVTGSEIVITSGAQPPDVNTGFIDGAISCEFHAPLAAMEDGRRISRTIRTSLTVRIVQTAPGVAGLRSERT